MLSTLQKTSNIRDPLRNEFGDIIVVQSFASNSKYIDEIVEDNSIDEIFNEEEFLKLPNQVFNPYRLLILSTLSRWGSLDFSALREGIQIRSDGNLANHLKVLEDLELIKIKKEFDNRKPKTFYRLTDKGEKLLKELKLHFKHISDDFS